MAETRPRRRARASKPQHDVDDSFDDATEDDRDDTGSDDRDESRNGSSTITGELRDAIREAAVEVLRPVALKATKSAAKMAVTKGPDLVKDKVMPMLDDAGGAGGLAKDALGKGGGLVGGLTDKLPGGGGGKKPTGHGRGRRLPVQEFVDVA